jgi:hypothetical protein
VYSRTAGAAVKRPRNPISPVRHEPSLNCMMFFLNAFKNLS